MSQALEEIVDLITAQIPAEALVAWTPSQRTKDRVASLITAEKEGQLTAETRAELNDFLELEHLLRLAKAKARLRLNEQ